MSGHPSDEKLVECAAREDAAVRDHVRSCGPCGVRFARLSAGASLTAAVRADRSAPAVDWSAIDPAVMAAAEAAAADIRRGTLRAPRRIPVPVFVGVALAAAAAGVFALRTRVTPVTPPAPVPVATREARTDAPPTPAVAEAQPRGEARTAPRAVEGVVLMVAAPVAYTAPGDTPANLVGSTRLREGGRIAPGERGGRAVVALHAGYRLDARAGAEVTLARLSSAEITVALSKGEARLDGPAAHEGRVAVEARGWTLLAKGGAFVTRIDRDAVRVRVVAGKIGVRREGLEEREALAGEVLELAFDGSSYRVVARDARDEGEIDGALFAQDGREFALPPLPAGAVLSVPGRGALPAGVAFVRTRAPLTLTAQSGSETWSLTLDPAAPAPTVWTRAPRAIVANASARRAPEAVVTAPEEQVAISARAVFGAGTRTQVSEMPEREREDSNRWAQAFAARAAHCFQECGPGTQCGASRTIVVTIETNSDGSVSTARSNFTAAPALDRCVYDEARAAPLPRALRSQRVLVDLTRTSP